jgi:hypothetical protein
VVRKRAPKFPGDSPLGTVDLDNKVIGTCKSDKLSGISVQLLYHEKITHLGFSDFANKAAKRNMIAWRLCPWGVTERGAMFGEVDLSCRDAATKIVH